MMTPGGGGTGQFGASDKLFAEPVVRVLVCGYTSDSANSAGQIPTSAYVTGAQATELVDSLESADLARPRLACPMLRPAAERQIVFYGVTASGTVVLPPVTTTAGIPACQVVVTNGTAIRYGWTLPKDLASGKLAAIVSGTHLIAPAEPSKVGTPAH